MQARVALCAAGLGSVLLLAVALSDGSAVRLEKRVMLASTSSPLGERLHNEPREAYDIAKARAYSASSPDEDVSRPRN